MFERIDRQFDGIARLRDRRPVDACAAHVKLGKACDHFAPVVLVAAERGEENRAVFGKVALRQGEQGRMRADFEIDAMAFAV